MKGDYITTAGLFSSPPQKTNTDTALPPERADQLRQLEAENKALKARVEQLSQFARAAAHDLKEPLRMIASYATLLERTLGSGLDPRAASFLEQISGSAQRAYALLDSMLQYAALSYREIALSEVDLNDVLQQVTANLQLRIGERGAHIEADPLPVVHANAELMVQVFQNLLSNAIKFTPPDRKPHIRIRCSEQGEVFRIEVADNGIGIPQDQLERIFEAFERGHAGRDYEGTGLGLAITRRILERLGGTIGVQSEAGKGSTFVLTLPKHS